MAIAKPRSAVSRLEHATRILNAANKLLLQVAACLRQLVTVTGWLVLLVSTVTLLVNPHVPPTHFVTPGAGALAVIQGLIKARSKSRDNGD